MTDPLFAGCDRAARASSCPATYFNPRTPCGVRPCANPPESTQEQFQSTHPLRGATSAFRTQQSSDFGFQSTHPLQGATAQNRPHSPRFRISIHAPLAGCDHALALNRGLRSYFNPRTPCGVRLITRLGVGQHTGFQSTHPLRGATGDIVQLFAEHFPFQSTHPLRGATRAEKHRPVYDQNFNPRTPCGVRPTMMFTFPFSKHFNPRTPCGVRP